MAKTIRGRKQKETTVCKVCKKERQTNVYFYMTESKFYPSGRIDVCKRCLKDMVDINNPESLKEVLRQVDKPYIASLWQSCLESDTSDPVGNYFRQVGSLHQYKGKTWVDSEFNLEEGKVIVPASRVMEVEQSQSEKTEKASVAIPDFLLDKWGRMFNPEEILDFESTYQQLRKNYEIKTAQHEMFLMSACINLVKSRYATAKGDTKTAKEYYDMFLKATQAGKLQPAQLSQADLSGGLDNFSALVRRVEEAVDIIPIMPRFRAKPLDLPDIVIWAYVNYVRSLQGNEEVAYEEVYRWYDQRKANFEANMNDSISSDDEESKEDDD